MKNRKIAIYLSAFCLCLLLSACGKEENIVEAQQETMIESESENTIEDSTDADDDIEIQIPSKEEVLAMRTLVLEGMTDEEVERLTENIKVANLQFEFAYLNDDIFEKLSDKDSLYWNYFDQKGDIQIGWSYDGNYSDIKKIIEDEGISKGEFYEKYGEPVIVYNRFDADNFINLIHDMQNLVQNEMLIADLQQLIDLTSLAAETHKMEYVNEIYKILHDLDYFLLRYGIEDVGKYTTDKSIVSTYYGVLTVYQERDLSIGEERVKISIEEAWELLRQKYYSNSELNEISYDENGLMHIVTWHGELQFSNDDELRPCDSVVFYDREENEEYIFGNWIVFYDGDEVYGTKTKAWYRVNIYTGEVSG